MKRILVRVRNKLCHLLLMNENSDIIVLPTDSFNNKKNLELPIFRENVTDFSELTIYIKFFNA